MNKNISYVLFGAMTIYFTAVHPTFAQGQTSTNSGCEQQLKSLTENANRIGRLEKRYELLGDQSGQYQSLIESVKADFKLSYESFAATCLKK